tara:strand:+ start:431 stop:976 length:546 start_codon:yes stop_codon:yes gene_type:complete
MIISRITGGTCDGLDTHESGYYRTGFEYASRVGMPHPGPDMAGLTIVDPFARDCDWANHTNDIDESTSAGSHMDALEYLKTFIDGTVDLILFDPPFSPHQAERYGKGMSNIYTQGNYLSQVYFECSRILKTGGGFLKLGYNSNRPQSTLSIKRMWIVHFGGNRNDVIMTLWTKSQSRIDEY